MSLPETERSGPHANSTSRALVPFTPAMSRAFAWPSARHGLLIAAFGLALGVGVAGFHGARHLATAWMAPAQPDPQTALLHRLQDEVGRLQSSLDALRSVADASKPDEPLRGLRRSVDALKQDVEQVRASGSASVAQLAAKIEKADHDPSPKLAEIAARLDRMERAVAARTPDPQAPQIADTTSHPDHAAKPTPAPLPTGSLPPPTIARATPAPSVASPAKVAALPPAKPEVTQVAAADPRTLPAKPAAVSGWVLRDVYDGMALVEGRDGDVREVEPGTFLPGAGEVRSIQRRGRSWVVLTSRGVIDGATF